MSRPRRSSDGHDGNPSAARRDPTQAHTDLARTGERAAAEFLARAGFLVVARNLVTRDAEFDLLVRRGRLLVAVEVKTRSRAPAPERCVTAAQATRLRRALTRLAPVMQPRPDRLRVDVVAVRCDDAGCIEVRHFPGTPFAMQ